MSHPPQRRPLADRLPEGAQVADRLDPAALARGDTLRGRGPDLAHLDEPLEHLGPRGPHLAGVERPAQEHVAVGGEAPRERRRVVRLGAAVAEPADPLGGERAALRPAPVRARGSPSCSRRPPTRMSPRPRASPMTSSASSRHETEPFENRPQVIMASMRPSRAGFVARPALALPRSRLLGRAAGMAGDTAGGAAASDRSVTAILKGGRHDSTLPGSSRFPRARSGGMLRAARRAPQDRIGDAPPMLLDGLGRHHQTVSTASPEAQGYFDQGLRLVYAFNHAEAQSSFREAARLDPACAMCCWGIALTYGSNYNSPTDAEREGGAFGAIQKAGSGRRRHAAGAGDHRGARETARGNAPGRPRRARPRVRRRHARGRAAVPGRPRRGYPLRGRDDEPAPLEPLDARRQPQPGTEEIVLTLERVLAASPDHPGALHLYIHAVEASPTRAAARRRRTGSATSCPEPGTSCTCPRTSTTASGAMPTRSR